MFTVLIVDDEKVMRQGIREIIDWEEYGIEIIGEAPNGQLAWEVIKQSKPDIVITDIKMPLMSGLELIKTSYEQGDSSKFIIISGYDDFEYVKKALKYNVENYLLKPIDRNEFIQTIKSIMRKYEREEVSTKHVQERLLLLESNLLNRIVKNNISHEEFREKIEMVDLDLCDDQLQIAIIDFGVKDTMKKRDGNFSIQILDVCSRRIDKCNGIMFMDIDGRIVIIYRILNDTMDRKKIERSLGKIRDALYTICPMDLTITVGDMVDSYKALHNSYSQAIDIQSYKIVKDAQKIIFNEDVMRYRNTYPVNIRIDYQLIQSHIRSNKPEVLSQYVLEIFDQAMHKTDITPGFLYNMAIEFVVYSIKTLKETGGQLEGGWEENILEQVLKFKSMYDLREWVIDIICKITAHVYHAQKKQYTKTVEAVLTYIEKHYNEEISLKIVSSIMYLNTAYLGRIFKKETGEVFSEYLTRIRIEKAKEMLMSSNMKIIDIAEEVGYKNINYFYALFKKITGLTPTEFRTSM